MMKRLLALCAVGLASGCADQGPAELSQADEAQLAAELANFEQDGRPVQCVNSRDLLGNRSVGNAAIIFEGTGNRIWVNRPPAGCPTLTPGRALSTRSTSTRLCRGDIANVFDPVARIPFGSCSLGEFTPFRRRAGTR